MQALRMSTAICNIVHDNFGATSWDERSSIVITGTDHSQSCSRHNVHVQTIVLLQLSDHPLSAPQQVDTRHKGSRVPIELIEFYSVLQWNSYNFAATSTPNCFHSSRPQQNQAFPRSMANPQYYSREHGLSSNHPEHREQIAASECSPK